jgi:hypothetical protein
MEMMSITDFTAAKIPQEGLRAKSDPLFFLHFYEHLTSFAGFNGVLGGFHFQDVEKRREPSTVFFA